MDMLRDVGPVSDNLYYVNYGFDRAGRVWSMSSRTICPGRHTPGLGGATPMNVGIYAILELKG